MPKKYYEVVFGDTTVKFRLTRSAQERIESKIQANDYAQLAKAGAMKAFGEFTPATFLDIFSGACSGMTRYQRAIFDEALNWKESFNTVKTTDDLYDLMEENDVFDVKAIAELLVNIATASGIISDEQRAELSESANPTEEEKK